MGPARRCALVVLAWALVGCASPPTPAASSAAPPTALASGLVVLTSPPPQPPAGLADASTPAYQPGTGFTPDAVKVITVLSLQVSLERYRAATGGYPSSLDALFPTYAPLGQDGQPVAGPPSASDGYAYTGGVQSSYQLSVRLSSGMTYQVEAFVP